MALIKSYNESELAAELGRVGTSPAGVQAAVEQARDIVATLQTDLGMTEEQAKYAVLGSIQNAAEEDGASLEQVYASYPAALKEYIRYSPEDLRRNQTVTVAGTTISAVLFLASFAFGAFAVLRAVRLGVRALPALYKMLRNPRAQGQLSNALNLLKIEVGRSVALLGVTMGFTTALGWLASTFVNNWNDVFHWGPSQAEQQAETIRKALASAGFGSGGDGSPAANFLPTLTKSKSAKPKMFLGVIYSGKLAETADFVRVLDDKITSDKDLFDDVHINLTGWMATLADRLNYEIQVKQDPYDLDNTKKLGTWLTLALYYTGKFGKRIPIDEILLGPIDPIVYWPTERITETIRSAVSQALTPELLIPKPSGNGGLIIPTREGEQVQIFPTTGPTQTPVSAPGASEQAPVAAPAPAPAPVQAAGVCAAFTLEEFFSIEGRALPSLTTRGAVYEGFGLGSAASYSGSAEQNNALLLKLKQQRGCPVVSSVAPAPAASPAVPAAPPSAPAAPAAPPVNPVYQGLQALFPSLPAQPFTQPQPAPAAPATRQMRVNTGGTSLNLRSAPDLQSSVVASIPHGSILTVSVSKTPADGYDWVSTIYQTRPGYVAEVFLVPA